MLQHAVVYLHDLQGPITVCNITIPRIPVDRIKELRAPDPREDDLVPNQSPDCASLLGADGLFVEPSWIALAYPPVRRKLITLLI